MCHKITPEEILEALRDGSLSSILCENIKLWRNYTDQYFIRQNTNPRREPTGPDPVAVTNEDTHHKYKQYAHVGEIGGGI